MREQRPYGKHELYIEDDLLCGVTHGTLTLDEIRLFTAAAEEVIRRQGHLLFLADNRESGPFEPEARRYVAQWAVGKPVLGIAIFNANLISRTLFSMVLKATSVLRKQPLPFDFFKEESEAREWLALLRRQHLTKARMSGAQPTLRRGEPPPGS